MGNALGAVIAEPAGYALGYSVPVQLLPYVGSVAGGTIGHEYAKNVSLPTLYANKAEKTKRTGIQAKADQQIVDAIETKLDSAQHASRLFTAKGKLDYYREYHPDLFRSVLHKD